MENQNNSKPSLKRLIIIAACIFVITYLVILGVWLISPIEDYYGLAVTKVASYIIAALKGVDIDEIVRNKDVVSVIFKAEKYGLTQGVRATITVSTGNYAFNLPLTLAIMAAFIPFIKNKWLYLEAFIIIVFVHILYVFSFEGHKITAILARQGFEDPGFMTLRFWEFLWGFVDNMVVRFEPFLIGAYLYLLRNRERKKKITPEKNAQKQPIKRNKPKKRR